MRVYDIINKKKNANNLTKQEIGYVVEGYTNGSIPDYQMSALLMAICFNGMDKEEVFNLTYAMASSGDTIDLSSLPGIKVDKHSTGGVGDKTTFIISSILASMGLLAPKMSGRGLGHTGGTIDKLESIPGFKIDYNIERFIELVRDNHMCIVGQTGNLVPADKKIYALRDVTATVASLPLIAASIMSKKLAAGADAIVLDVKVGSGAFMKTLAQAKELAAIMVDIGTKAGKETVALITNMDAPLGTHIGNALEIIEAIDLLKNKESDQLLKTICKEIAKEMLILGGKEASLDKIEQTLKDGSAYKCFENMIVAQQGDLGALVNIKDIAYKKEVFANKDGYIAKIDAEKIGISAMELGAGRVIEGDKIDHSAGIILHAKTSDYIKKGDILATMYTSSKDKLDDSQDTFLNAIELNDAPLKPLRPILSRVDKNGTMAY